MNMINRIFLTPTTLLFLSYGLIYLLSLTIYRICFYLIYKHKIDPLHNHLNFISQAFLIGLRFDLSVISGLLMLFVFLSGITFFNRFWFYRKLWSFSPIIVLLWTISLLVGDTVYFNHANKHIGYEGLDLFGQGMNLVIQSFAKDSPIIFGLFFIFYLLIIYIGLKLIKKLDRYLYSPTDFKQRIIETIVLLVAMIIFLRGGFQTSFIRPSFAFFSNNEFLNQLGLNGVFTTFYDLRSDTIPKSQRMELKESIEIVQKEIQYPEADFIDSKYPLLRKSKPNQNQINKQNIVLIILEGYTAKFLTSVSSHGVILGKEVAPFLNRLIKESIFYPHFFATGGRTSNGLLALLTGIPDPPGRSVVHRAYFKVSGIGEIMKHAGYKTTFITGSDLNFENLRTHIEKWGFETIIDQRDIDKTKKYKSGLWGYDDADSLEILADDIGKNRGDQKFFSVLLTISTHYPYKVLDKPLLASTVSDSDYLNAYHYTDQSLEKFFHKIKDYPTFANTIFLITADHTHHRNLNHYEDRNIPLIIYAPSLFSPKVDNTISSQLDMVPTVVSLTGMELKFSAMGRSLFSEKKPNSAYYSFGPLYGWLEDENYYLQNISSDKIGMTVDLFDSSKLHINKCNTNKNLCNQFDNKSKAYLNLSNYLMEKNQIFP